METCFNGSSPESRNHTIKFAQWNSSASILTMKLGRNLSIGTVVSVRFTSDDSGLRLPIDGVRSNQSDILLFTNAVSGPVPREPGTAVLNTQAVGAFDDDLTLLSFVPQQAGVSGDIVLKVKTYMPLRPGDIFSVVLPNFVGADTASDQTLEFENDPSTFGRVAWRSANHTLSLSVNESV